MSIFENAFDLLLAVSLIWIAWNALTSKDLFRAVVLLIVFGIITSLAWIRLDAPDIALAEAAIGAGLTGVLFLDALGYIRNSKYPVRVIKKFLPGALTAGLCLVILAVVIGLPENDGLAALVMNSMENSGVSNSVTAVLLNFRAYDTLLEVGVLVLAAAGVLSLRIIEKDINVSQAIKSEDNVLSAFSRLMAPLMVLASCYLLYAGTYAPGGAFQAGAVLAASLVLLRIAGFPAPAWIKTATNSMIAAGLLVFLVIAGVLLMTGRNLLQYPSEHAGSIIFFIETILMISIAFILAELFSEWRGNP